MIALHVQAYRESCAICAGGALRGKARIGASLRMLRPRLLFDLWYLFRPPWDTGESPPELLEYLEVHSPGRAIDLGCGTGTNVLTMLNKGWDVTGLDFSPRAIGRARRQLRRAGKSATLESADLSRKLGPHPQYDFALDIGCFHVVSDRRMYLENLVHLLRPGADWLMYGFIATPDRREGPGVGEGALGLIENMGFRLMRRTDGWERARRPSAWFLFQKIEHSIESAQRPVSGQA